MAIIVPKKQLNLGSQVPGLKELPSTWVGSYCAHMDAGMKWGGKPNTLPNIPVSHIALVLWSECSD